MAYAERSVARIRVGLGADNSKLIRMATLECSKNPGWNGGILSIPPSSDKAAFDTQKEELFEYIDRVAADPTGNPNGFAFFFRAGPRDCMVAFCAAFVTMFQRYKNASYFGSDGASEHLGYVWIPGHNNCPDGVAPLRHGRGHPDPFIVKAVFDRGLFSELEADEEGAMVVCEYTACADAGCWAAPAPAPAPKMTVRAKKRARAKARKQARAAGAATGDVADAAASVFAASYADASA